MLSKKIISKLIKIIIQIIQSIQNYWKRIIQKQQKIKYKMKAINSSLMTTYFKKKLRKKMKKKNKFKIILHLNKMRFKKKLSNWKKILIKKNNWKEIICYLWI